MTDDEIREVTDALIRELRPLREFIEGVRTVVEGLVRRVEVLELERLHERPARSDYTARPD